MGNKSLSKWKMTKYSHHLMSEQEDEIARESAVTIMLNGEQYATIVCTPTDMTEMVIGFLATEGIIRKVNDMKEYMMDEEKGFAYVVLHYAPELPNRSDRWIGSCCGKSREFYSKQDVKTAKTIMTNMHISKERIYTLMKQFEADADIHGRTGGVHQAAIASIENIIASYIDIGRHNALDKLYGHILKSGLHHHDKCILFSGRMSSEVILKVSKMGIGIVIAKSAPTDLALRLAEDLNITAIGFARESSFNVYTHASRISTDENQDEYLS